MLFTCFNFQKGPHEPATHIQRCIFHNYYTQKWLPCALLCGMTFHFYILLLKVFLYSDHFWYLHWRNSKWSPLWMFFFFGKGQGCVSCICITGDDGPTLMVFSDRQTEIYRFKYGFVLAFSLLYNLSPKNTYIKYTL